MFNTNATSQNEHIDMFGKFSDVEVGPCLRKLTFTSTDDKDNLTSDA